MQIFGPLLLFKDHKQYFITIQNQTKVSIKHNTTKWIVKNFHEP
jgi:hypothetical protein